MKNLSFPLDLLNRVQTQVLFDLLTDILEETEDSSLRFSVQKKLNEVNRFAEKTWGSSLVSDPERTRTY